MSNTIAVVVAALGAAFLSTGGAFMLDERRARRLVKQARNDELKSACAEMISSAQKLMFKAAALHINMQLRSGIRERLDLALHHRKPIDILELNDYLMAEQGAILDAQAIIWLLGDEPLYKCGGVVVEAVRDLVTASTALPPGIQNDLTRDLAKKVSAVIRDMKPLTPDPNDEAKIDECARKLGRACAALVPVMRKSLNVKDADALFRSFPGLQTFDSNNFEVVRED